MSVKTEQRTGDVAIRNTKTAAPITPRMTDTGSSNGEMTVLSVLECL